MVSKAVLGVFWMTTCGVVAICEIIFSKLVAEAGWPYFRIGAASMVLIGSAMGAAFLLLREKVPLRAEMPWVLLRGFFCNGTLIAVVLAVRIGATPGDSSALTSINIVIAAMLGHVVLGEHLRWPHLLALVVSIVGAALVAQPEFLFGARDGGASSTWMGYLMALLGGLLQAFVFICARKSADVSGVFASSVEAYMGVVMFLIMPLISPIEGASMSKIADDPLLAAGYVAISFCLTSTGILAGCLGSMWCPAAVGATVMTAATMVTGYVAQTVLFGETPQMLTMIGAGLMLGAVCLMAVTRTEVPEESAPASKEEAPAEDPQGDEVRSNASSRSASLLSFAASEFSQVQVPRARLQQRRTAGAHEAAASRPAATSLGAAVPAMGA
uniref:EamA domain-containing protein n=1 Tax=Alexandrium monilatum TaxID=311494 RepID=A0A7S4QB01_9DINO|mmetsp:Transcript_11077/g.34667  ORF Transcript_11077/g.34667 Transcript_11077/m.34667 type:complete len:385 (+) Transcript_11077:59-1213(+)